VHLQIYKHGPPILAVAVLCRMKPALFLDRDGILIQERGDYSWLEEHFLPIQLAIKPLRAVAAMGYPLVVVTNQSGVAKGLYTNNDVEAMHNRMRTYFGGYQIEFTGIYYCPHHPDFMECECRKPLPGMLLQAATELEIDLANSLLIGDTERDVVAAQAAGVQGFLIEANVGWPTIEAKVVSHFHSLHQLGFNG